MEFQETWAGRNMMIFLTCLRIIMELLLLKIQPLQEVHQFLFSLLRVETCKMIMYMMSLLDIITAAVRVVIMIHLHGIIAVLYRGNGIRILKNQGHMTRSLKKLSFSLRVEKD